MKLGSIIINTNNGVLTEHNFIVCLLLGIKQNDRTTCACHKSSYKIILIKVLLKYLYIEPKHYINMFN